MNVSSILRFAGPKIPGNPFTSPMLITNQAKAEAVPEMQMLTLNFVPSKSRVETLEDRVHTVVPMVMLVEGVHNGSGGPVFYTADELSKTPAIWNQKPIVDYHPEDGSACDQIFVNSRKVGVIMNAAWDAKGKRLTAEAWLEKDRADKIDNRIFRAIEKNEMMEVSTGLFVDLERAPGKWGEEEFVGTVRNIRPDHLALLPDKIGACSIADGAGLLRNELRSGKLDKTTLLKKLGAFLGLTNNELSHENLRQSIQAALKAKLNVGDQGPWVWVEAVYSNFFVYDNGEGKLFRLNYTSSDTGVTLGGEAPVEVFRVTEFRTVEGAKFVGNQDQPKTNDSINDMNKEAMIVAILAANCGWSDRKALEGLNDTQIKSIHNGVERAKGEIINEASKKELVDGIIKNNSYGWDESSRLALMMFTPEQLGKFKLTAPAAVASTTATTNGGPQQAPITMETWLGQAPAEVSSVVRNLLSSEKAQKDALIEKITSNKDSGWTKEGLQNWSVADLTRVAKVYENAAAALEHPNFQALAPNYSGQAPTTTTNDQAPAFQPLVAPVMNFKKEPAKAA